MSTHWTEDEFWDAFTSEEKYNRSGDNSIYNVVRALLEETKRRDLLVWPLKTQAAALCGFQANFSHNESVYPLYSVWSRNDKGGNGVEIVYDYMRGPFANGTELQEEARRRFSSIGIYGTGGQKRPNIEFSRFSFFDRVTRFFIVIDWMISEIEKY